MGKNLVEVKNSCVHKSRDSSSPQPLLAIVCESFLQFIMKSLVVLPPLLAWNAYLNLLRLLNHSDSPNEHTFEHLDASISTDTGM